MIKKNTLVKKEIFENKKRSVVKAKGSPVLIPEPSLRPRLFKRAYPCFSSSGLGNETQTGDAAEDPGKSFLFCLRDRDHGILSEGEMVLAIAVKGYPEERRVSAASVVVLGLALENPVGG